MGILEPETLTLFDGWIRLLFFTAGSFNLILCIESYLENEEFYENIVTHIFVAIASIWFTCELLYIPNEIFGNSTDEGGLVDILRIPWTVVMAILACMSMGVVHESNLLRNDVILWSRIPIIALGYLLASTQQLLGFTEKRQEWSHGNDVCHGWKVKRWYERAGLEDAIDLIPDTGIKINVIFALFMVVTPGMSIYAELIGFFDENATTNQQVTHVSVLAIDSILLVDALLYATRLKSAPIHLFTVLVQFYIASKASEVVGSVAYFIPLTVAIPFVIIELIFGSRFGDYAEWIFINFRPRTAYRLTYTVAVWAGVFALVAWTIGWYGEWITIEIDNGTIVQTVLDFLESLEEAIAKFLYNVLRIINILSICGTKAIDPTLTNPQLLDPSDGQVETNFAVSSFMVSVGTDYITFYNGTTDDANPIVKECCICDGTTLGNRNVLTKGCTSSENKERGPNKVENTKTPSCLSTDQYFKDIIDSKTAPNNIQDLINFVNSNTADGEQNVCKDGVAATKEPEEPDTDNDDDVLRLGDLETAAAKIKADPFISNPTGPLTGPSDVPEEDDAWDDPVALIDEKTCDDIICYSFVAIMAGGTAASFLPFIGGAISFAAKTAAKVAYKIYRYIRSQYRSFSRSNRRRKKFRKKRRALKTLLDVAAKFKAMASFGIQATEDLIYPFLPLFALGLVSFFAAFWRREDSGEARSLLGGVMLGLLVANVASMLIVRFIPTAITGIADALPEELIIIKVNTHTGWEWMQIGVFSSLCSSFFWALSMLLGQPKDACEEYGDGSSKNNVKQLKQATIVPIVPDTLNRAAPAAAAATNITTLTFPKWSGKGKGRKYHPKKNYEEISAPSYANHPLLDSITPFFNKAEGQKGSTAWINNFCWMVPVILIIYYAFEEELAVFKVTASVHSEVHGAVTDIMSEEGSQESLRMLDDDVGMDNLCGIVEKSVKSLIWAAATAAGLAIVEAVAVIVDWFKTAFAMLRDLAKRLIDLDLPIWYLLDNTTLLMAYGCPMLAALMSVIGLLLSILPLPSLFYELVNLDILRSFQYMLAIAGLTVASTMYGMSATISAVPIPLFNFKVETTHALTNAIWCNIIILVSFFNNLFNGIVPLYDRKHE